MSVIEEHKSLFILRTNKYDSKIIFIKQTLNPANFCKQSFAAFHPKIG